MTDSPENPERHTGPGDPVAENRRRQRELYGEALGDRVHRLLAQLGITQARLASAIGLSPAMLSQLCGARRVKIGDPAVLGRLVALDQRVARGPVPPEEVDALLAQVRASVTPWGPAGPGCHCAAGPGGPPAPGRERVPAPRRPAGWPGSAGPGGSAPTAEDALRGVTPPARLVAAAATLAPSFPEIAEVLRRAAARR